MDSGSVLCTLFWGSVQHADEVTKRVIRWIRYPQYPQTRNGNEQDVNKTSGTG